ncbi:iron ABC transporter permease [Arachnia propionica]|uniref:Iron ABC transporter permease n=1 Tax=Arachnia propionica TaxID=1750 RepID=A0A3P1TBD8_9ACTN|nr:iron ABC transporter permease [Arachnia propionica]MDO5082167.1 iron ABC transporter permease [Arachnia propionica]RRD06709.1 iron ABC transporter permease [Arachnia propionica]
MAVGARFLGAGLILTATVVISLWLGPARVTPGEVWAILSGGEVRAVARLIVLDVRLPRILMACLAGAALGVAGLAMQTLFRNPLADPYILGLSSGASLGVAAVILVIGGAGAATLTAGLDLAGDLAIVVAAALGSALVMLLVLVLGRAVRSSVSLLLIGVMLGYLTSAGVSVMISFSTPELIAAYARWGFGSYGGVTWGNLRIITIAILIGLLGAGALLKTLDSLLLGERYAASLGVRVRRDRGLLIAVTSVLAGTVTAFCGPIQFLGIAIPHVARGVFHTSSHRVLIPATALLGACIALLADLIATLPGDGVLPLNAVNAAFGAPVVIWLLIRRRRWEL